MSQEQINSSPAQREDFTDPQAGNCRKAVSSGTMASALTPDPGVNFFFTKAPVFAQANAGRAPYRTLRERSFAGAGFGVSYGSQCSLIPRIILQDFFQCFDGGWPISRRDVEGRQSQISGCV